MDENTDQSILLIHGILQVSGVRLVVFVLLKDFPPELHSKVIYCALIILPFILTADSAAEMKERP